jgi:hypothetical protein
MEIKIGFDKLPSDGEACEYCGLIIYEKMVPFVQVGGPEDVVYLPVIMCEPCYLKTDENVDQR